MIFTTIAALEMLNEATSFLGALAMLARMLVTPPIVAVCLVLPGFVLVGLPATWLLSALRLERPGTYAIIGTLAGAVVPSFLAWQIFSDASWILIFLGAFSGGVTAWTWGKSRAVANGWDEF